ncbi:MAG: valine--tRNA ligase [Spirochaetes bacterium]|nr:valine--tRNA ligase [Spirochaetota bacterium]
MKAIELAKAYDPKGFEDRIYAMWKSERLFEPAGEAGKQPFVVVIPPPNVTGVLHMGHGLNNSLQDISVRYNRMLGRPTLWVPGTDHAGIATQNVVERRLRKEGRSRHELGRESFVEETWKTAREHKAFIRNQLARIGASVDWSRERFTLDDGLSRAVRDVFVMLYERGLVYRGEYLVNWCTSCGTALSDDEVEHADENGKMYHIWYELADGSGRIEIATTRPETLLGDTAVAVHPDDERYAALVGERVKLPLTDRLIPVIADSYVDRTFGTGIVKITPAHDANDFEVGNRHGLQRINVLAPDGTLNDNVPGKYRGMKVVAAREAVLADLEAAGLLKEVREHAHAVGHCYRCGTTIEPFLSKQWFVRMKPLAEKALKAWRDGDVVFYPKKWEHTYEHWLTNIRDWCISRQLWWGHRIPVWYCDSCGHVIADRDDPVICPKCRSTELRRDEDVLDTWFSSWLWPFSTLGWPKDTADFRKFYPTSTLMTGYDIIFFWVARMIMAGMEFTGKSPFRDVCIHGLVRDKQGRKMSKSLGNGLDPLEIVDEYGADALKFTLAFNCASGQDVLVDRESFKLGSRFANKLWNASRYILGNLEGRELLPAGSLGYSDVDRWILHRLNAAAAACRGSLEGYRFNEAAQAAHEFFWNDFCDWYIEATKISFRGDDGREKDRAATILLDVLEETLALLHPLLPFVTEEIYGMLPNKRGRLIVRKYPEPSKEREAPELGVKFGSLQELVRLVRTLRSEFGVAPEKKARVAVRFEPGFAAAEYIIQNGALVALLANAPGLEKADVKPEGAVALVGNGFEAWVIVRDVIDAKELAAKLSKDAEKERSFAERLRTKLSNGNFTASAPEEIVRGEREKLAEAERRIGKLEQYVRDLA